LKELDPGRGSGISTDNKLTHKAQNK